MRLNDQQIKFNVLKSLRQLDDPEDCQMIQSTEEIYYDVETYCLDNSCLGISAACFGSKHLDNHLIDPGEKNEIKSKKKEGPSNVKPELHQEPKL
ncbi:hypothetical protein V6N13_123841 [Hibiscus sabdariffa]